MAHGIKGAAPPGNMPPGNVTAVPPPPLELLANVPAVPAVPPPPLELPGNVPTVPPPPLELPGNVPAVPPPPLELPSKLRSQRVPPSSALNVRASSPSSSSELTKHAAAAARHADAPSPLQP